LQSKTLTNTLSKENASLKTQFESLKKDYKETKDLLVALQKLTMDNSQKISELSNFTEETNILDTEHAEDVDLESSVEEEERVKDLQKQSVISFTTFI
jgi:hypothetical protein